MGNAVNPQQATDTAMKQAGKDSNQPDFANMTGEQAKAWVAAQKEAEAKKQNTTNRDSSGKFTSQKADNATSNTPEAVKAAAQEAKRKIKVDDQEIDEEEILKVYRERKGHQRAANKELQEGKALRKQSEEFIGMMRDKAQLFDALKKLGHDPRKLAEEYLVSQLQDEQMDPRDKELRDAKAKLKQIEDLEKKQQAEVERRRSEELKAKYAKDYETQFVGALEKHQLPPTKPMVAEMAKYIGRAAKIGFKMTADEAAQLVRQDIEAAHRKLIGDSDGEILLKLLGEEVANKIRKFDVAKIKSPEQVLQTPKDQRTEPRQPRDNSGKRMSTKEWQLHKRGLK